MPGTYRCCIDVRGPPDLLHSPWSPSLCSWEGLAPLRGVAHQVSGFDFQDRALPKVVGPAGEVRELLKEPNPKLDPWVSPHYFPPPQGLPRSGLLPEATWPRQHVAHYG